MIKPIHRQITFGVEHTFGIDISYNTHLKLFFRRIENTESWKPDTFIKNNFYKKVSKFTTKIQRDSDCVELPSHKFLYSNLKQYDLEYLELKKLMSSVGLVESSSYDDINKEGGGHIHIGLQFLNNKKLKNLFLRNMYIFSINYPELGWIFNNPHDKDNSRSLLTTYDCMGIINSTSYADKDNGLICNTEYNTMELRFLMMHRNLEESHLHLSLAFGIYNYLYRLTKRGIKLYMNYTDVDQFPRTYKTACDNAVSLFNLLGLSEEEITIIRKTRFKYMKFRFDSDKYYKKRELCC